MPYDPDKHHRRSIRLAGYNYAQPGAYFVTICTHHRKRLLGRIADGVMSLSPIGRLVDRCWHALPRHFSHIALDTFVVMPDHIHGIIIINTQLVDPTALEITGRDGTLPSSLPAIIQNFKSISTRQANRHSATPGAHLWQRNYYERILHDQAALCAVRRYIISNVAHWNR